MVRHLIITVVALLLGIAPAVRAACDVSCVGGSHRTQAVAADHCDKTADHDVPAPDGGCKHEHVQSAALAGTAKGTTDAPLRRGVAITLAAMVVQVMLGGMVSSSFADLSCDGIADCAHIAAQQGWPGSSLNPWREPHVEPVAQGPVNPDGALAQLAHRLWAPVVLLLALPTAWLAWRRGARGSALALIALLALQVAAGVWLLTPVLPLPAALLHNLLAALLVTLLARLL